MSQITWQRAIFTGASPDIVAADMLNFCVRDGNRWILCVINTDSIYEYRHQITLRSIPQNWITVDSFFLYHLVRVIKSSTY